MVSINYLIGDEKDLDSIAPLWEMAYEENRTMLSAFPELPLSFSKVKEILCEKMNLGPLRIDLAKDSDLGNYIGFCVSSILPTNQGFIDALYVSKQYRYQGIGDRLVKNALTWLDTKKIEEKIVTTAVMNTRAIKFYSNYGFTPKYMILAAQFPK